MSVLSTNNRDDKLGVSDSTFWEIYIYIYTGGSPEMAILSGVIRRFIYVVDFVPIRLLLANTVELSKLAIQSMTK